MLATLIPLFDENMSVRAYSLFSQKVNYLTDPRFSVSAHLDGAGSINGLEIIESMGMHTLTGDKEVFVPVNNVSIFADIAAQCRAPHNQVVIFVDNTVKPTEMYINRLKELKSQDYKLAIWKLTISDFEPYKEILSLADYAFLNYKKIDIAKAKIYFSKVYPNIKLIAGNITEQEDFEKLTDDGGYSLYEGPFYRMPVTKGDTEIAPLKINYIELLNIVNDSDFDLTDAADIIGRDTALVISLLKMVNRMTVNSEITTIRHAAAMLGQKELKKWITTAVTQQLCSDKPSEIMRLSLLRAKFAENLASGFNLAIKAQELFLVGLFSVLDLILNKPMKEALEMLKVSNDIKEALICHTGDLAQVLDFIIQYENANWQEISRLMIINDITMNTVFSAYTSSLEWYRDLFQD